MGEAGGSARTRVIKGLGLSRELDAAPAVVQVVLEPDLFWNTVIACGDLAAAGLHGREDPDTNEPEKTGRMVRTDRFKYVVFSHGSRREMLFDLESDPGEMHDLAADSEFEDEIRRHRRLLKEWQQATQDTMLGLG